MLIRDGNMHIWNLMRTREVILVALFALPVAAGHFFNLEGRPLTAVSALISACLSVVLITTLSAKIPNQFLRTVASLALASLFAVYYFGLFLSYYLQGSYFNQQFFFHMNLSTLVETWRVFYPLIIVFMCWMVCVWSTVFFSKKRAITDNKSYLFILLILALAVVLDPGLRTTSVSAARSLLHQEDANLETIEWDRLQLDRGALRGMTEPALPGKNLVMVFLEGFENTYTDQAVFPNLTPNLLALNSQGWQLENLHQQNGTGWTMAGLVSSLCGTPLLYESGIGRNNIMFTEFLNRAVCLPDVLRSAGYNQVFMGGASLEFGGKGNFFKQHSFDRVYGRDDLREMLPDPSHLGGWGLYDDSLFDLAAQEFEKLSEGNAPFHLTMLTVDTHHPSGEPSPECPEYGEIDNPILRAVHCTDYLVGRFIERLRSNPAYPDTLIVILSDHLAMRNSAFPLFPPEYERRVYFNVLNSDLRGSSTVMATPMDIAPTVLGLLGVRHSTSFLAGKDIASATENRDQFRPGNPTRNRAIAYLNSHYLTSEFTTNHRMFLADLTEYDFQNDIVDIEELDRGFSFTAAGNEPVFLLPKFENLSDGPMSVVIELDAPGDTRITLFFVTSEDQEYSFEFSRSQLIKAGSNRVVFPLPANADHGRIRVHPGAITGRFTVHSVEIQS